MIVGLECKKLKMKCEIAPGEQKCKHCVRRQAECIFRTTRIVRIDEANDAAATSPDKYEYVSSLVPYWVIL